MSQLDCNVGIHFRSVAGAARDNTFVLRLYVLACLVVDVSSRLPQDDYVERAAVLDDGSVTG